jgi:hypothetical protein
MLHDFGDKHLGDAGLAAASIEQSLAGSALPGRAQSGHPGIFDGSTIATGPTKWITTEFGIGLASVSVLIAIYFWRRRAELTSETAVAAVRRHNQPT